MLRKTRWAAALVLAAVVGACGGEPGREESPGVGDIAADVDQEAQEALTEVSDEPGPGDAPPYATPAPVPVIPVPNPPGQRTVVGSFRPVGGSDVDAGVTVAEVPEGTMVSVTVSRAPRAGAYQLALHRGRCPGPGEEVASLSGVRVSAAGAGTVTDTLPVPAATVMNGQHVLVLRPGAGAPPVACADIPVNR